MPRHLPAGGPPSGDPEKVRNEARALQTATDQGQAAPRDVQSARSIAGDPWRGAAGDAFRGASAGTHRRVDAITELGAAAAPVLMSYATALEAAKARYAAGLQVAEAAGEDYGGAGPGASGRPAPAHRRAEVDAAEAEMRAAVDMEQAANDTAAEMIKQLTVLAQDPDADAQQIRQTAALVAGYKLAHQADLARWIAERSAPGSAENTRWTGIEKKIGWVGTGAAAASAGLGQFFTDGSNPYYSSAERWGRGAAQAATVGFAAWAGGTLGAAGGQAALPIPGVGAAAGATAGGYLAASAMDSANDWLVDKAGDLGDTLADGLGSSAGDPGGGALDNIGPW